MDRRWLPFVFAILIGTISQEAVAESSFKCTGKGIFSDPADCHDFYSCDADLTATHGSCMSRVGSFDEPNNVCTILPCSPTDPPKETPPLGAFDCSDAVGVFADPRDCHSYYICYTPVLPRHYTCTTGRYDPESLGCLEADC